MHSAVTLQLAHNSCPTNGPCSTNLHAIVQQRCQLGPCCADSTDIYLSRHTISGPHFAVASSRGQQTHKNTHYPKHPQAHMVQRPTRATHPGTVQSKGCCSSQQLGSKQCEADLAPHLFVYVSAHGASSRTTQEGEFAAHESNCQATSSLSRPICTTGMQLQPGAIFGTEAPFGNPHKHNHYHRHHTKRNTHLLLYYVHIHHFVKTSGNPCSNLLGLEHSNHTLLRYQAMTVRLTGSPAPLDSQVSLAATCPQLAHPTQQCPVSGFVWHCCSSGGVVSTKHRAQKAQVLVQQSGCLAQPC